MSLRFARSERNYSIERDGTPTLSRNCANSVEREVSAEHHRVSARNPSRFESTKRPIKKGGYWAFLLSGGRDDARDLRGTTRGGGGCEEKRIDQEDRKG